MKNSLMILRQLDSQLASIKKQGIQFIPKQGWVRTLRKALGITIKQLAKRLHVVPSRIVKIETSELEGNITLKTLQTVTESMECQFVYSFIPKTTLEEIIRNKAKETAITQIKQTSHTMELEAQSVDLPWLENQIKDLSEELLRHPWRHLWEEP